MGREIKLHIYKCGSAQAERKISMPIANFQAGEKLLPLKTRELLEKEAINLAEITQIAGKTKGKLIEIETATERIEILIE